jgi:hypothetical protein
MPLRHVRLYAGHPRLYFFARPKDVDGRTSPAMTAFSLPNRNAPRREDGLRAFQFPPIYRVLQGHVQLEHPG